MSWSQEFGEVQAVSDCESKEGGLGEQGRVSSLRWTVCAMLFAATSINYMDRQVIAILKPTLESTIGLTEIHYAYVVDAFQVAYAIGLVAAGIIVDKLGTRIGYLIIMVTWSVAGAGHVFASSAFEFGVARFFLGLGESGNFPAAIKTVAEWFPQSERSFATGVFNSGANVGAVLAPLIVPAIVYRFGWHAAFLSTTSFSLLWILWWFTCYRKPTEHSSIANPTPTHLDDETANSVDARVPWITLLRYRQTWAFALAKFFTDPIWWFYLFWLPSYFSSRFHLTLSHLGLPLVLIYNMSAFGSIGGGWLPTPFRRIGLSASRARFAAMWFCACLILPISTIGYLHSEWTAIILLGVAAGAHQGWSANLFTTASDMFSSRCVGSVVGIGGMAGSIGGALLAFITGHLLERTHSYVGLFIFASLAYLIALCVIQLLAPGLKQAELAA